MYSREEVYNATLSYFSGDDLATNAWIDKYCLKDKENNLLELTPDMMHRRLADEFARIESKFKNPLSWDDIYHVLKGFKYIVPQGRPMAGIGNPHQICSIGNCFAIDSPHDSYAGILKADEEMAQIFKRGGGVGINISTLRPNGSPTSNSSRGIEGATQYMDRYSYTTGEVAQDGRRGALMIAMDISHPDSERFITKKIGKKSVTNANISVWVDNKFMECAAKDDDYGLSFNGKSYGYKKAKELFNKIVQTAHASAEPGLLFKDNIIGESPADCYDGFKTIVTNPCLPSNVLVKTKRGLRYLFQVDTGDEIWSKEGWTTIINKQSSGIKKVFEYSTSAGSICSTDNHKFVSLSKKVEAKDAVSIDLVPGPIPQRIEPDPSAIMDGLLIGDGSLHIASDKLVHLYIGENDQDYFKSEIKDLIGKHRPSLGERAYEVGGYTIGKEWLESYTFERDIPTNYLFSNNENKICNFLRGLYSANGSFVNGRVTLKTSSERLRFSVQLLLSSIGIRSYYTTNKPKMVEFSNGKYLCKESYDINISTDRDVFTAKIGFLQNYKNKKMSDYGYKKNSILKTSKIKNSEFVGETEVFDITVDNKTHTFWCNGFDISNCGELPLSSYNSCMLLLLNLSSYVIDPFTPDARINDGLLKYHSQIAQRLMDDMIELEIEKINAIINKIVNDDVDQELKDRELSLWTKIKSKLYAGRRTGTGITGLGDMLAMLNCSYADDKSIQICDQVFKIISTNVYTSSIRLAHERGAFESFNHGIERKNKYLNRILGLIEEENPYIWEDYCKYGRRNIACLTIAPAGTVSLMTGTTSGVEPLFMPIYKRRRRIEDESKCVFKDNQGKMFEEYIVVHPKLKEYYRITNNCYENDFSYDQWMDIFASSPYSGSTAQEINPIKKVDMQAIIQKYIDHSISNTYNLKKDTTVEEVENLYMYAWEKGLKGITIYRDGSLDAILSSVDDTSNKSNIFVQHSAPKRPKELKSSLINITSKGIKYAVIIGFLEEKPYEVFAFKIPEGWDVKNCDGVVTKIQKGRYDFTGEGIYLKNIHTDFNEIEERAITLSTSMLLRTGAKIEFVCKTLKKINPTVNSFTSAIARVLSKYIPNGEVQGEVCPKCGGKLIREDGCVRCTQCANSKCNFVKTSKNGKNI